MSDHQITIGDDRIKLDLIKDDGGTLYEVIPQIPERREPLIFSQNNWTGGHGQYSFSDPTMYFEGQSIDTTQDGRIILGPVINQVGISGGSLDANPVCFLWFAAADSGAGKWMVATATKIFWLTGTNFVKKWDRANHNWANSHGFITDDWVRPSTYNGHIYECTSAGTGGASEPNPWTTTDGDTEVTGGATFTCRSITITGMYEFNQVLFVALSGTDEYFYSADAVTFTESTLTIDVIHGFKGAPNPASTANILWGWVLPNKIYMNTVGTNAGAPVQWDSGTLVGDTSNDITNIFLHGNRLLVGKEDNLYHYDSDGGIHPQMDNLLQNRSSTNFKYITEWQANTLFSEGRGMSKLSAYDAITPADPLLDMQDIGKIGDVIGLAADKEWIYVAKNEGTNTHIYKGVVHRGANGMVRKWCPWISFVTATYPCATMAVAHHSSTDRRLWFGYGNYAAYVILSDNPTADSGVATFAAEGWLRMSYEYGTNKNWDELWQSVITETKNCASTETATIKYRKDTDTSATTISGAITKNGVRRTFFAIPLDCKRIQFEIHLATGSSSETPEVLHFEARGIEKPEIVRVHRAVYAIGDEPTARTKTIRDKLRDAAETTTLIKFTDLRYKDSGFVWVVLEPGYPQEIEIMHEKERQPELGLRCLFREVDYPAS